MKDFYHKQELNGLNGILHSVKDGCFRLGNLTLKPKFNSDNSPLYGFDIVESLDNDFNEEVKIEYVQIRTPTNGFIEFEGLYFINKLNRVVLKIGSFSEKLDHLNFSSKPVFDYFPDMLNSNPDSLINLINK